MVESLRNLLTRPNILRPPVRRSIANAYYARGHRNWKNMKSHDLDQVHDLMAQNLEEDPANVRDLRVWFQAYRRLINFDILEAIDRLSSWAMREDSAEAHYYLYILHFLRWRQGILQDHRSVIEHIGKCRALAGKIARVRSFEWLAKTPPSCPLVHQTELGRWDDSTNFYENTDPLALVGGTVKLIKGPQSGQLALGPFEVFFVPGNSFFPAKDENKETQFYLGFSYDGFRAWRVKRATD